MTNAEKFKEDWGFEPNVTHCPKCGKESCMVCPYAEKRFEECASDWWNSEYKGTSTIPLSVIEKIHDAVDNASPDGFFEEEHGYIIDSMLTKEHVDEIIDKAVKECTHENT